MRPQRQGEYTSASAGALNFNQDLGGPVMDAIAVGWDNLFSTQLTAHLRQLGGALLGAVSATLGELKAAAAAAGADPALLARLAAAAEAEERRRVADGVAALAAAAGARQRDLSREVILPRVKASMAPAYAACTAEVGGGQFMRMKAHMARHVEREKGTMFKAATGEEARLLSLASPAY